MSIPTFTVDQLEEALEEREGSDRRKKNRGEDTHSGEERRENDRRNKND